MITKKGTTLVEVLVAVTILAILSISIYSAFNLFFQVLSQKKSRVEALSIATEKMEIFRNLSYHDIGTVGGIPAGTILQSEEITRNNTVFTIQIQVSYIDDAFDGTLGGSPNDLLPTDYKRIRIAVSWPSRFRPQPIMLLSDITPRGVESTVAGGTLSITVLNAQGVAVPSANIQIINTAVTPNININTQTNSQGKAIFPGAPASADSYQIIATKAGYSTEQTYPRTALMPNPLKPYATVLEGQITDISFAIDLVSNLNLNTYNQTLITNQKINSDTGTADQYLPSLATDVSGNIYFSWQDNRMSNDQRIYSQKYNSSLVKQWGEDTRVSTANNQSYSSATGDGSGNTYITWQDDSNGNQDVYVLKINSSGIDAWGGGKKINTNNGSSDQTLPNIVRDGINLYISWTDFRNGSGNSDIYLHKIDTSKNYLWPSEIKVNSDSASVNQTGSKNLMLGGNVYLVWTDYRNGDADIYLQKISPDGTKLLPDDLKINSDASATTQIDPAIATDGTDLYITWSDNRDGNYNIYAQKISTAAVKLWASDLLVTSDSAADAITPAIIVGDEPQLYFAWIDNRNSNNDLFGQAFSLEGTKIWDYDLKINDDLVDADQLQPQMIIDTAGRVIYAWVDDRTGNYDLYVSGYSGTFPTSVGNVPITIRGGKLISATPQVYKYDTHNFTTNAAGALTINDLEWDTYTITVGGGNTITSADPGLPLTLNPGATQDLKIYLQ